METSKAGSFLPDIDYSYPPVHKSPEPDIVVRSPTNSSSKRNSSSRGWRRDSALDDDHLRRGLKPRHISFIALGGVLGTGLFLGTGDSLGKAGPLGLLLGYSIFGAIMICLMQGLGEMAAYMPLAGGHVLYASRFVDKSLGFAIGWTYALIWVLACPAELSAVAVLVNYWIPDKTVSNAVWILIALGFILALNLFPVAVFGEAEFIFTSIKIVTIIGLIVLGIAINCGAGPNGHYIGFEYWRNPGTFGIEYLGIKGAGGKWLGFWAVFAQAGFSYIGTEIVALTAAESANPTKALPLAIKQIYLRICVFYILGTFILGLNCPSNDPRLGSASDASASPFVIAIMRVGYTTLPHVINAAILLSAWSAANADIYVASRTIYSLAKQGGLPKVFLKSTRRGVPYVAVCTAATAGLLALMTVDYNAHKVFNWFASLVGTSGLIVFTTISITYLRFRKILEINHVDRSTLPFRSNYARFGAWVVIATIPVIAVFSGWTTFFRPHDFDVASLLTYYLPVVLFPIAYGLRKLYSKSRIMPLDEVDIYTGSRLKDELLVYSPGEQKWWQKISVFFT